MPIAAALEPFSGIPVSQVVEPPPSFLFEHDFCGKPVAIFPGHALAEPKRRSAMKRSNPDCDRGIGLVARQRGLFGRGRGRSQQCSNAFDMTYFEWLFLHPIEHPRPVLMPVRLRAR
jgi:hypothetical protein